MQTRAAPFPGRTLFWRELFGSRVHHLRPPSWTPAAIGPTEAQDRNIDSLPGPRPPVPRQPYAHPLLQWSCQHAIAVFAAEPKVRAVPCACHALLLCQRL